MFSFFILTIQTSLVPLPAGLGRHAATPAQHHHKLPATFPGHFPITTLKTTPFPRYHTHPLPNRHHQHHNTSPYFDPGTFP